MLYKLIANILSLLTLAYIILIASWPSMLQLANLYQETAWSVFYKLNKKNQGYMSICIAKDFTYSACRCF